MEYSLYRFVSFVFDPASFTQIVHSPSWFFHVCILTYYDLFIFQIKFFFLGIILFYVLEEKNTGNLSYQLSTWFCVWSLKVFHAMKLVLNIIFAYVPICLYAHLYFGTHMPIPLHPVVQWSPAVKYWRHWDRALQTTSFEVDQRMAGIKYFSIRVRRQKFIEELSTIISRTKLSSVWIVFFMVLHILNNLFHFETHFYIHGNEHASQYFWK